MVTERTAESIAKQIRRTHLLNIALAAGPAKTADMLGEVCDIAEKAIATALRSYGNQVREECARIADVWADTKPDLEKSHSPTTARAIASIVSATGAKVAAAIRQRIHDEGKG